MPSIGVAIIGSGQIVLANHVPGLALCPDARLVALCDANPAVLEKASAATGVRATYADYQQVLAREDVHAVIIATPNYLHPTIAIAAAKARKHILCEKPIALDLPEALAMLDAAREANVRHMTAFTYRFVPAMRYMAHLVARGDIGVPWHFRAQRFQDWGTRDTGWRQVKKLAGSGELGDMLSHRIDYAHLLFGRLARVVAQTRVFVPVRQGHVSELDDWVAILGDFESDATAVLESTKLATGRGEGGRSPDVCEVNGDAGTLVYNLGTPHELLVGKRGGAGLERVAVPREFWVYPGSSREAGAGEPGVVFRYDQDVEFIDAIREGRDCVPSFVDGARTQAVMDAALQSAEQRRWVDVPRVV